MSKGKGYRTFDVGGYEVLVGKASRDNDALTFGVAKGADIWMHVGGETPGSHVVIRLDDKGEPPRDVVEGAAAIAAWYSKARGAPFAKVDFCRRSDVSKPKGAPAGMVQLKKHKTIKVKPGLPESAAGAGDAFVDDD
jgi:predicted ribosome quality control (RQC) complex YloA/Tae2 family protein